MANERHNTEVIVLLCEKCHKNTATVHMQQIVNGEKMELHLCIACSLQLEMPISFENLFQGFMNSLMSAQAGGPQVKKDDLPVIKCVTCGMTYDMFKANGKLGCAECYHTFANEMDALLKNVQGSIRHEGKFPQRSGVVLRQKREVDRLRVMLTKAVEAENYEEAASLRDRIREMEVEA